MTNMDEPSEEMKSLYDELDTKIQNYIKKTFEDQGLSESGDYIAGWALVVNYGNIERTSSAASGYIVEAMPANSPPHVIKGIFREGIDWVAVQQDEALDDDDI